VPAEPFTRPLLYVGRYAVFDAIAKGGFASVHLGRAVGVGGFVRTVAVKRLHRQFARDPEVSAMFLDEARMVARIRHPNVLPTLDLIADGDELFLVMEYVEGVTLGYLLAHARERKRQVPLGIVLRIVCGALRGLHAAHEAKNEQGEPLQIIHRDVSPDNILVGTDGHARILDFGVAQALGQYHDTKEGEVRGKLAYMTPEQVSDEPLTRRSDVFSASIVLWEAMTGKPLFASRSVGAVAHNVLTMEIPSPTSVVDTPKKLDGIVLQGLERDPNERWVSAERMAAAIEAVGSLASEQSVAQYVRQAGAERLAQRAKQVAIVEAAELDMDEVVVPSSRASAAEILVARLDPDAPRRASASAPTLPPLATPEPPAATPPPPAVTPAPPMAVAMPPASANETSSEIHGWSDPPRLSHSPARRAVIPILVVAAVVAVALYLLRSRDEPEVAAAPAPPAELPASAAARAATSVSAAPAATPSSAPEPSVSASATPAPSAVPSPGRPAPPKPKPKPPPLYGRE
jgi:serine/threonine-protein kinase